MAASKKTSSNSVLAEIFGQKHAQLIAKQKTGLKGLDLFDFITTASPHYEAPHHLTPVVPHLMALMERPGMLCFSAPPRMGKALRDDTPMPTNRGWIEAKDVQEGDFLYGSDGKFTQVTGVFPQGEVELFKVSFSDHSSLVVCADHQWSVRQRYYNKWHTKSTRELMSDLKESDGRKKWRIPMVRPVEGRPEDLPIDPYLLGLWLGDGTSRCGAVTTMDGEIRDHFESQVGIDRTYNNGSKASCYFSHKLRAQLKAAGLLQNKHVPDIYKTSPVDVRLAVLQGLADTDGTVGADGSQQSICTTLPRLRDDICELVCSLGGKYTVLVKNTGYKPAYTIHFRLATGFEGFRLERKRSRLANPSPKNIPRRFIASIEPAGRGHARCFSVEAPDHLYCAGRDYIVTHNSVLVNHYVAWAMLTKPNFRVAYGSYSLDLSAGFFSGEIKDILHTNGVRIDRTQNSKQEWRIENGSTFKAVAPGSGFTGRGADMIVIDDPYKSRQTAESAKVREEVMSWFRSVAITRRSPECSVLILHTRWVVDDLIGTAARDYGVPYVNLPAINDEGESLWPKFWPKERLLTEVRPILGEYDWSALYQGQPRPRGGAVFQDPAFYTKKELGETKFVRKTIGIDCAYTTNTKSDYSSAVVLGHTADNRSFVLETMRVRMEIAQFAEALIKLRQRHDNPPVYWYIGGIEKGLIDLFAQRGIRLSTKNATVDKFTRSQPVAAAWNSGRVLIPDEESDWCRTFTSELLNFTGVGDIHDDQVDALAAAYMTCERPSVYRGMSDKRIFPF